MNSAHDPKPRAAQSRGGAPEPCSVCGDPIGEQPFCRIHRQADGPIILCCPDCTIQYLHSARAPADPLEQQLRDYEKSTHFFIGEDKPWL